MPGRKRIYLCLAKMSETGLEQKYIQEAFDANWVAPAGANIDGFEADLKRFLGGDREVACLSSGTAAIHLALLLCGVGPGDEVLVQSFTFCASAHPVTYLGATPVFVDSEKDSWNMDPELLEEAIRDRIAKTGKVPGAIVPAALYGMPYQIDRILAVADKYGIPVVEDAAEGMGSSFGGRMLGTFGKFGVLSFNGNKMITTSGGGALICEDANTKEKAVWYAMQAREAYPYYQHEHIGYNYRISNICAGIGRGQMSVVDAHIAHHRHVQAGYEELLRDVPGITMHGNPDMPGQAGGSRFDSNFWLCSCTLAPEIRVKGQENVSPRSSGEPNENVEALRRFLDRAGIETRPLWKPMHRQPVYESAPAYLNGVSDALFRVGLCLPAGPRVSDAEVRYIAKTLKSALIA